MSKLLVILFVIPSFSILIVLSNWKLRILFRFSANAKKKRNSFFKVSLITFNDCNNSGNYF